VSEKKGKDERWLKEIIWQNSYSKKYQFPRGIGSEDDRRAIGGYGRQGEMALS
jgi:hypothetical protein